MLLDVLNVQGQKTGRTIDLPDAIFNKEPNEHAVYLAVKQYLAAQRQGTHRVKNRKEVQGASKKLHKQKGTGGSRKGNLRNPLYKGGGTIFGPKPRSYDFKLNKKVKDLAKISALSSKVKTQNLIVLENPQFQNPQTKQVVQILKNLDIHNKKTLFVTDAEEKNLYLSSRNLPKTQVVPLTDMNTYGIMNSDVVIFLEGVGQFFKDNYQQ